MSVAAHSLLNDKSILLALICGQSQIYCPHSAVTRDLLQNTSS